MRSAPREVHAASVAVSQDVALLLGLAQGLENALRVGRRAQPDETRKPAAAMLRARIESAALARDTCVGMSQCRRRSDDEAR